jgi:hypothetical protein
MNLADWGVGGEKVLYFGDHLFNDLKVPHRAEGWKTGVIIGELEKEVEIQNSEKYRLMVAELMEVQNYLTTQFNKLLGGKVDKKIAIFHNRRNETSNASFKTK